MMDYKNKIQELSTQFTGLTKAVVGGDHRGCCGTVGRWLKTNNNNMRHEVTQGTILAGESLASIESKDDTSRSLVVLTKGPDEKLGRMLVSRRIFNPRKGTSSSTEYWFDTDKVSHPKARAHSNDDREMTTHDLNNAMNALACANATLGRIIERDAER